MKRVGIRTFFRTSIIVASIIVLTVPYGAVFASAAVGDNNQDATLPVSSATAIDVVDNPSGTTEVVAATEVSESDKESEPQGKESESAASLVVSSKDQPVSSDAAPPPTPTIVTTQPTNEVIVGPETTPPIIVTSLTPSSTIEFAEFYNQSDNPIDVMTLRLQVSSGEEQCTTGINSDGWILPGEFFAVSSPTVHAPLMSVFDKDCLLTGQIDRVETFSGGARWQLIDGIMPTKPWLRHKSTVSTSCVDKSIPSSLKQTGSAANDYVYCDVAPLVDGVQALRTSDLYIPPETTGLSIIEIMSDSRSCAPDDASFDCFDFIKVKNMSDIALDLAPLRLRTGSATTSSSSSNTFHWGQATLNPARDEYILSAGATLVVRYKDAGDPISITNGDGNVWIEDYYGVKHYSTVTYKDMDLAAAKGKSWMFDEVKKEWAFGVPSPYGENQRYVEPPVEEKETVSSLKPCREGQYRNPETNRCRALAQASTLVPCREGQYRSTETNRCRSIATLVSALKPCADDQFRNPATNRCKKIASADDVALADCGEGRERNPETNRCRNVQASTPVDVGFPVEEVTDTVEATLGWWAIGGVGVLAAGYGVWEWRKEIADKLRSIASFFVSGR